MAEFIPLGSRTTDIGGRRFGSLVVLGLLAVRKTPGQHRTTRLIWLCQCDCGGKSEVSGTNLRTGKTASCGCRQERQQKSGFARTHGLRQIPEYQIWIGMKKRCINPKRPEYIYYGGRGIEVCDRWMTSFENFYDDMGKRPSPKHSIERNDNDGNYEPSNCRWATATEQANNRRPYGKAFRSFPQTFGSRRY